MTKQRALPADIVSIICRTQGIGRPVAENVAKKLSEEVAKQIVTLACQPGTGQEILRLLGRDAISEDNQEGQRQETPDNPPPDPDSAE